MTLSHPTSTTFTKVDASERPHVGRIILTRTLSRVIASGPRRTRWARDDARDNVPNLFFIDASKGT